MRLIISWRLDSQYSLPGNVTVHAEPTRRSIFIKWIWLSINYRAQNWYNLGVWHHRNDIGFQSGVWSKRLRPNKKPISRTESVTNTSTRLVSHIQPEYQPVTSWLTTLCSSSSWFHKCLHAYLSNKYSIVALLLQSERICRKHFKTLLNLNSL